MRLIWAFLILLAAPVTGQEMSSDYVVIGYVDLTMQGEDRRLPVVVEPAQERSYARLTELHKEQGINRVDITGVTPSEDGKANFPVIALVVNTNKNEMFYGIFIRYSLEPFRNDYAFTAATADKTAKVSNLVTDENGLVEYDFRGQLTHRDRDPETGETTPQAGRDVVEISGHVRVIIPAKFRD